MDDIVKQYEKEDFNTEEPYRMLFEFKDDGFKYMQVLNDLEARAAVVQFKRFKEMVRAYAKQHIEHSTGGIINNTTCFREQELELYTGEWYADESGIRRTNAKNGVEEACSHPIMPVMRLLNIDDASTRLKIAFKRNQRGWETAIVRRSTLFSAREIKQLADAGSGVSVGDANAGFLAEYMQKIEDINYDSLPEKQSVSHLGWTKDGKFAPYMDELEFDGVEKFRDMFGAVKSHGKYGDWLTIAQKVRQTDSVARIALASSFASVLIKVIGKLNYIVHMWGGSGTGKTVAQLLAISVWGNPNDDAQFLQTFNSTAVGLELLAGFMGSIPLMIDEFQLVKDKKSFESTVYMLCEGIGKTRGAKGGGLQNTPTWKLCAITSGESPITYASSGGGAVNRIVEIECKNPLFEDVHEVLSIIRSNYGFAGKMFVTLLDSEESRKEAKRLYEQFYKDLGTNSTEKQTMAGAMILTADALATKWIFCDDRGLTVQDIEPYLSTKESVDVGLRGYEYILDFCGSNAAKFNKDADPCYGIITDDEIRVIKPVFEKACDEAGYNAKTILSWIDQRGLLDRDPSGNPFKVKKINGNPIRCACIKKGDLSKQESEWVEVDDSEQTALPFA